MSQDAPQADAVDAEDVRAASDPTPAEEGPASLLDRIRGERTEAIVEQPTEDFKFPSADRSELVWIRVRPLDPDEQKKLRARAAKSKNPDSSWLSILDTIATATDVVLVRRESGALVPLHEMLGEDEPYLFGPELAAKFAGPAHPGLESAKTARQCIERLAGVDRLGRLPVEYLYSQIMEWMADGITEADEELLGE